MRSACTRARAHARCTRYARTLHTHAHADAGTRAREHTRTLAYDGTAHARAQPQRTSRAPAGSTRSGRAGAYGTFGAGCGAADGPSGFATYARSSAKSAA